MTLLDVLAAWEFKLVLNRRDRPAWAEHPTGVVVRFDRQPAVVNYHSPGCEGLEFPGCKTVGDLRKLLHLLDDDLHLPGEKVYDEKDLKRYGYADDEAYRKAMIEWHRADWLELKLDGRDSE